MGVSMEKKIDDLIRSECDRPCKREYIYASYFTKLINILANKFVYRGLPDSVPPFEIEVRLLLSGHAICVAPKDGDVITSWGSIYGVDIYGHPNQYTAMQAGMKTAIEGYIGISAAVIYASITDLFNPYAPPSRLTSVQRTSSLLTDIDLSMSTSLINNRSINAVVAKDTTTHEALEAYYGALINGETHVPFVETGILPTIEDLHKGSTSQKEIPILDLQELRAQVFKTFYNENGIRVVSDKRERMITSEIDSDNDFLEASTRDELEMRQRGIKQFNEVFGYNAEVEVNNYVSNDMATKSNESNVDKL